MSVRGTFALKDVDKVEASMTVTMTVGEWKSIRNSLPTKWPEGDLGRLIAELVSAAERQFFGPAGEDR